MKYSLFGSSALVEGYVQSYLLYAAHSPKLTSMLLDQAHRKVHHLSYILSNLICLAPLAHLY